MGYPDRLRIAPKAGIVTVLLLAGCGVAVAAEETGTFDGLRFRAIGPAVMGGRIDAVTMVESTPWVLYVGTASGGLWKSANGGTTWAPLFDREVTSSIGDVAVAPSDSDIVWVGTGEPNNRQSSTFGAGVYKSEDGGRSFTHVGLEDTQHIGRILVHPNDPSIVYVAALGGLWSANEERGVFRTKDGGGSWERVLHADEDTGAVTLAIDPVNPYVLYAAMYTRRRTPFGFVGGGTASGLFKTTDGGESWRRLGGGLPTGAIGRIGIDVYRRDPRIVFALVEHGEDGGLYRSLDRGESWEKRSSLNPRPMYYSKVHVDPNDPERVYVLGSSFHVSDDGGASFITNRDMTPTYDVGVHGDHHSLVVDPAASNHLVLGGDGGLYVSWDRGTSWRKVNNLPLGQFYDVAVDMREPYRVYAGAQDTHSWMGPSATRNQIGIVDADWVQTNFGDGMYQQADPSDPNVVYTESQGGNLVRLDPRTGDRKVIKPYPEEDETDYRFHWTSPMLVSRHEPSVLYFGGNRLFISGDRGESWTATGDLTRAEDRDELPILGAVPDEATLSRHDGVADWGTITTIAESPRSPDVLWVGTDDGRVQISRDRGKSWRSVEQNLPAFDSLRVKVSRLVASSAAEGRVYASFDRHHLGDFSPYVFVSEDHGESWRSIGDDLPERGWVNAVDEHPDNPDVLFAGTETGVFLSLDRGTSWLRMTGNFPTVPVDDLLVHPRDKDLVVGTHGRSIYILDDVTPLARYRAGEAVQLFEPRQATIFLPWKHESYSAQAIFVGENPAYGVIVTYFLAEPRDDVELRFLATDGELLRELKGPGGRGFQRVAWDLRPASASDEESGDAAGPLVPPGRYRVELVAGDARRESSFEVVLDPRLDVSAAEFRERYEFLRSVDALHAELRAVAARADELEARANGLSKALDGEANESLREAIARTLAELGRARNAVAGEPGRSSFRSRSLVARASRLLGELSGDAVRQGTLHAPTSVQKARLRSLQSEARSAIERVEAEIARAAAAIEAELPRATIPIGAPR